MKTVLVGLLLFAGQAVSQDVPSKFKIAFTEPFNFTCPDGEIISYLSTTTHTDTNAFLLNYDRIWDIECRKVTQTSDCDKSSDWINLYMQPFKLYCPETKIMTGMEGYYDAFYKTRMYKIKCCVVNQTILKYCNSQRLYDTRPMTTTIPEGWGLWSISEIFMNGLPAFSFLKCKV